MPTERFAEQLIAWQRVHGRHALPWQNTHDPYRIWLSEIMLQQTQVSTVIPYYERFLASFPDVAALAAASADEVMARWAGLGYYSRARNLHRCAIEVMQVHGGRFPLTAEGLQTLPGIGRSTAAAIAAFAYGERTPILDGNVKRVFARVFGIEGFPGEKAIETSMWTLAERLLPESGGEPMQRYTQGLMDLGATLCGRGAPVCQRCPFTGQCVAEATGRQRLLPTPRARKATPTRRTMMMVLRGGDAVLLQRRAPLGIWGGLWCLPEGVDANALGALARNFGATSAPQPLATISHTFTHFKLDIEPLVFSCPAPAPGCPPSSSGLLSDGEYAWVESGEMDAYGVPAPVRRILDALRGDLF